ncbi:hypothetical protein [Phycicoccus duodecadis]|uniref:Uncharacterized protein n=1 Tax=Phycicoccus duodecadis TaxID=173053 RepID=A0A2N3YFJ2_9MICO|nr:hypothetical protein [Phycicoccus duodecadis]PKW25590.1 hypothetical protein ATL31_0387 [Phycicoccus duodecadis]
MSDRPGEMDERDVDERFASIVAGWDLRADGTAAEDDTAPGASAEPPAPDAAGATPSAPSSASSAEPTGAPAPSGGPTTTGRPPWVNPSPLDGLVPASSWRVVEPPPPASDAATASSTPVDDDEHFEPPQVELPPQEDLHFWGAVLGLVAGPLCLVYVALARPFHSTRWFLAGLALSLGGFALLVLRQPRQRDEDDDGVRL